MAARNGIRDTSILLAVAILLFVFQVLYSAEVSSIFFTLLIIGLIISPVVYPISRFPVEFDARRLSDILWGLGGFAVYIVLLTPAVILIKGSGASAAQSIVGYIQATTPILAGSTIVTLIVFGILGPITESVVIFGRIYEFIGTTAKVAIDRITLRSVLLATFIAAGFTFLHLQARVLVAEAAIFDNVAIISTFLFGAISMAIIFYRSSKGIRELSPIIWMHVFANISAILIKMGNPFAQAIFGLA